VVDLAMLGVTLRRPEVPFAWRLVTTLTAVGLTLVDALAVRGLGTKRRSDVIGMDLSPAPRESWRGSGLAEDVGVSQGRTELDDAQREQRMRDAQEQLGLPDPDSRDTHRV
jgi:hypothetical protein